MQSPIAEVTHGFEMPDLDAGTQFQTFHKISKLSEPPSQLLPQLPFIKYNVFTLRISHRQSLNSEPIQPPFLPLAPPTSNPDIPYPPNFLSSFSWNCHVQILVPRYPWIWGHPLNIINPQGATTLSQTGPLFPRSHLPLISPLPLIEGYEPNPTLW